MILENKSTIHDKVKFRGRVIGEVVDEVCRMRGDDYKNFLQRIQLDQTKANELGSEYAYRWCYFALSEKHVHPTFGQFALLQSEPQLHEMLQEARDKGWPI